jgi:hypothetical protein
MVKTVRKKRKAKKSRREKKMQIGGTNDTNRYTKKSKAKNLTKEQIEFLKFDRIINKSYLEIKNQLEILENILF